MQDAVFGRWEAKEDDEHHSHTAQQHHQFIALSTLRTHRESLQANGVQGWQLFEQMATLNIDHRIQQNKNRCPDCWHDKTNNNCICTSIPIIVAESLPNVQFWILMHHKEYLNGGNSAKLLLQMLPKHRVDLYLFGRTGDFDKLAEDIRMAKDPEHILTLWPGEDARTLVEFIDQLPSDESSWKQQQPHFVASNEPRLRVIALDGTYSNAKHMAKALKKRLGPDAPKQVALHPTTMSVFHRAQKQYGAVAAKTGALRISTAEACALLLTELGAPREKFEQKIVQAVLINNQALSNGSKRDERVSALV